MVSERVQNLQQRLRESESALEQKFDAFLENIIDIAVNRAAQAPGAFICLAPWIGHDLFFEHVFTPHQTIDRGIYYHQEKVRCLLQRISGHDVQSDIGEIAFCFLLPRPTLVQLRFERSSSRVLGADLKFGEYQRACGLLELHLKMKVTRSYLDGVIGNSMSKHWYFLWL